MITYLPETLSAVANSASSTSIDSKVNRIQFVPFSMCFIFVDKPLGVFNIYLLQSGTFYFYVGVSYNSK